MSAYRSNLNSISNNVLRFARHNDTHSNDALETLLTNIYTAVPAAIIVQSGVNWRTTDFQAWAIYYNPEQIFDPAAPNLLEVISQVANENNFAYTGEFSIEDGATLGLPTPLNEYFCFTNIDYQAPGVADVVNTSIDVLSDVINSISEINLENKGRSEITFLWQSTGGTLQITTLYLLANQNPNTLSQSMQVYISL